MLQHLIEHYHFDINQLDAFGRTALFYANEEEVASYLIQQKSDITVIDEEGNSLNSWWASYIANNSSLTPLNKVLGKALESLPNEVIIKLQKPTLYQMAARGNKDTFLKFLRSNPFTVDDSILIKGQEVSLMAFTALEYIRKGEQSQSILRYIIEKARSRILNQYQESLIFY